MNYVRSTIQCLLITCLVFTLPASAQQLEEIIVTAQKREQSLQEVGISVAAFTGEELKNVGVQSQEVLAQLVPNFTYGNNGAQALYYIRGDGLQGFITDAETPVGYYFDEVYFGAMALQRQQLFDVERAEVLRGPQGILFGRNTTAGLMHFISRKPTEEFEGYLEAEGGSNAHRIVEGAISGPLSDAVRGRLSFKYNEDDGWQENSPVGIAAGGGEDFALTNAIAVRGQLAFDLGESAELLLKAGYSEDKGQTLVPGYQGAWDPVTFAPCSDAAILANQCVNANGFPTGNPEPDTAITENTDLPNDIEVYEYVAKLDWQLTENIELVSVTSYYDYFRFYQEEIDSTTVGNFLGNTTAIYETDGDQVTQELRLHGNYDRLGWVAGVFYFDDNKDVKSTLPELFGGLFDTAGELNTESWAVFGHAEYELIDTVTVLGGVRYTDEKKDIDLELLIGPNGAFDIDDSEVTWKAGVNWQKSEDALLYASISKGYKAGEFNSTVLFGDLNAAIPVGAETNINYEVGTKLTLLDGRMNLNATLFYTDISDKQGTVSTVQGALNLPVTRFVNYGDVEIYGLEADIKFQLTEQIYTQLALGWLETETKPDAFTTVSSGPAGDVHNIDGNELSGAPNLSLSGLVRYDFPATDYGNFSLQTDFTYQTRTFHDINNTDRDSTPAYGLVNVRMFWESEDGKYYGQAFVENATDKDIEAWSYTLDGFDYRAIYWGRPLWWGVKGGIRF